MMIRHTRCAFKGPLKRDLSAIVFICPVHAMQSVAGVAAPHEDDNQAAEVTFSA